MIVALYHGSNQNFVRADIFFNIGQQQSRGKTVSRGLSAWRPGTGRHLARYSPLLAAFERRVRLEAKGIEGIACRGRQPGVRRWGEVNRRRPAIRPQRRGFQSCSGNKRKSCPDVAVPVSEPAQIWGEALKPARFYQGHSWQVDADAPAAERRIDCAGCCFIGPDERCSPADERKMFSYAPFQF